MTVSVGSVLILVLAGFAVTINAAAISSAQSSLEADCLSAFNEKRRLHQNTPDLVWDGAAEEQAQAAVDAIPAGGSLSFGNNNYYGATGYTLISSVEKSTEFICQSAVDKWYEGADDYDYSNPGYGGSFTQLIWKSSTQLGVGISIKQNGGWYYAYVIAYFYVAGNNGDYLNNVMLLKGTASETAAQPSTTTLQESSNNEFCLQIHNEKRALHQGTGPLFYNASIEASAQQYAEYLAANNIFNHDPENTIYGENLYLRTGTPQRSNNVECEAATLSWYNEISLYNYNNPGFSSATGHFTQVVWKSTTQLGIGIARNGNKVYVVARYDTPGNVIGRFSQNVAQLI